MKKVLFLMSAMLVLTLSSFGQIDLKQIINKEFIIKVGTINKLPRPVELQPTIYHFMKDGKHRFVIKFPEISKESLIYVQENTESLKITGETATSYKPGPGLASLTYRLEEVGNDEEITYIMIFTHNGELYCIDFSYYGNSFNCKDLTIKVY